MADESTNPSAGQPSGDETIPLEPAAPSTQPTKAGRRPSILESETDICPNCKEPLAADAIVCMSCGYDMQAGRVLTPATDVDLIEPPSVKPPFVKPGIKPGPVAIGGAVALVAAMIAAGVNASSRGAFGASLVLALLALYKAILHTGTGLAGLWAAAKFVDHRLNNVDLATARIFAAVASFMLVISLRIPMGIEFLESTVRFIAAVACYWLVVFALFRRSRLETSLITLFHLGAVMFVELGFWIAIWLQTAVSSKPG